MSTFISPADLMTRRLKESRANMTKCFEPPRVGRMVLGNTGAQFLPAAGRRPARRIGGATLALSLHRCIEPELRNPLDVARSRRERAQTAR